MEISLIDTAIILLIASIVGYYVYLRYKEEKRKKEKSLIPTLKYYKQKFYREKDEYTQRAEKFKNKMEEYKNKIQQIKGGIKDYQWEADEKKILKTLKGTDFEWTFSVMFEILGYKVSQPPVYKDHNIDYIITLPTGKNVCIDFIDHQQAKKIDKDYIQQLLKGKDKYQCEGVWVITNGQIPEETKKFGLEKEVVFFGKEEILFFFPSIRIVEDYYEYTTKFHNYELLHKEMTDEIIRRQTWIKEVEEKLEKAYKKVERKKLGK
ncbi:MAG: hypothetical protein GXO45_01425 [Aquificae bacterium]|nr:hypothetical protein [Aquificota bacterium]